MWVPHGGVVRHGRHEHRRLPRAGRSARALTRPRVVAGYTIRMPALAVHTIGAGGGSVARIDAGGALVVGPESTGAVPGPPATGEVGRDPTVTDADLVLGRIPDRAPRSPGLGRARRRRGDGARMPRTRGRTAEGIVAGGRRQRWSGAVRVGDGRAGRGPSRDRAGSRSAGAGPAARVRGARRRSECAPVDRAAQRAGVLSARSGLVSCAADQRELVRSWPTPRRSHAGPTTMLRAGASRVEAAGARSAWTGGGPVAVETFVDCRYRRAEPRADRRRRSTEFPVGARAAERVSARYGAADRGGGAARPRVAAESPLDAGRAARRLRGRGSSGRRVVDRAGLHGVGAGRLGRGAGAGRRVVDSVAGPRPA